MKRIAALVLVAACSSGGTAPAPTATPTTTTPERTPVEGTSAPVAGAPVGRVVKEHFTSAALGVDKDVVVYLPAGYDDAPAKHWPVLYYLHGLGGDETDWLKGAHLDQAADAIRLGAIVVMPDGDDGFYVDSTKAIDYDACMKDGAGLFFPQRDHATTCVKHMAYESYIVKDLIGWVDQKYRTIATRDGRGIAGLSMGGFGALQLSMRHQDLFAAAASHSGIDALLYGGPFPYDKAHVQLVDDPKQWAAAAGEIGAWMLMILGPNIATWRAVDPAMLAAALKPGQLELYFDCGTEDHFRLDAGAHYLGDVLSAHSIHHTIFFGPGDHNMEFWSARLPLSLLFFKEHLTAAK